MRKGRSFDSCDFILMTIHFHIDANWTLLNTNLTNIQLSFSNVIVLKDSAFNLWCISWIVSGKLCRMGIGCIHHQDLKKNKHVKLWKQWSYLPIR